MSMLPCQLILMSVLASCCIGCSTRVPAGRSHGATAPDATRGAAVFFSAPPLSQLTLSPDGQHIAGVRRRDGAAILVVYPAEGGEARPLARLDEPDMHIRRLGWGGNDRIVVSIETRSQSAIGVRARQTRLFVVPIDDGNPRYLGKDWPYQEYSQFQDDVIDWMWRDPTHVLLSLRRPGTVGAGAYRVDLESGRLHTVVRPGAGITTWASDHRGDVRVGRGFAEHATRVFEWARNSPDAPFETIADFDYLREDGFVFAGFAADPDLVYVHTPEDGRSAVYEYRLSTRTLGRRIFAQAAVDVGAVITSPRDGRLLAVAYVDDRPRLHFVDEEARREQVALDRALPGTINRVVSTSIDERLSIVQSTGDTTPPTFYLFRRDDRALDPLTEDLPALDHDRLATMTPITYDARDGVRIHGYLTVPKGARAARLPTIVYVHGGPTTRDVWGWNPVVQFLVSHGFAVLQPNYRGSSGYGREHERLGYRQWGGSMQDDVTDGVHWLVAEGIADPDRVGVYGESYGGYAALMGAVKTPNLFRAAASFAGVTDIEMMLRDDRWYRFGDHNVPVIGDVREDRTRLRAASPLRNAARIQIPVLLGHGADDPTVHVRHSRRMASALERAHKIVEFYVYPKEPHGLFDEANRIDFYEKLATFFERHLGQRVEESQG